VSYAKPIVRGLAAALSALVAASVFVTAGCSSGTSQQDARDRATTQTCNWFQTCHYIGSGMNYATYDQCEVDQRAQWENRWPPASCDGKIDESALETCLAAILSTDCTNILDIGDTLVVKCAEAKVCEGSTPDGGT
jgi:hypothetical protein